MADVELAKKCAAPGSGFEISYPASWHTVEAAEGARCRYFHPEPFTPPSGDGAAAMAIAVRLDSRSVEELVKEADGSPAIDVVDRRSTGVGGRPAVRLETRARDRASSLPREAGRVTWYVSFPHGTLVAAADDRATAGTLKDNVRVLDAMVASASPVERSACSAAGAAADGPAAQELPPPVAATRDRIVALATRCDFAGLAGLALEGSFTYSFGHSGDPAVFWEAAEAEGSPILRVLVEVLNAPVGRRSVGGATHYLWPSAYRYERWEDVPQEDRDALRQFVTAEDLRRFATAGAYLGFRVGITGSGDWIFYVAGD